MNVLVYTGPSTLPSSVSWITSVLKTLLVSNYTVQTISAQSVSTHPWTTSCALLVLPTYSQPESSSAISQYVESGGRLLAFGASFKRRGSILALGTPGSIRLSDAILNFDRHSDLNVPEKVPIEVLAGDSPQGKGFGGILSPRPGDIDDIVPQEVFARFIDTTNEEPADVAAVRLDSEKGKALIWSLSLDNGPDGTEQFTLDEINNSDQHRLEVLRMTLLELGLRLPSNDSGTTGVAIRPLPQMLMCAPWKPKIVTSIFDAFKLRHAGDSPPVELKDTNDTFHFWPSTERDRLIAEGRAGRLYPYTDPATWQPKHVIIQAHGSLPPPTSTSLFDCPRFFEYLKEFRKAQAVPEMIDEWGHGEALMYGEVVTSTQTMIDRNPKMLVSLPSPFVSLASHQLVGRGRGSNVWLSPAGCLQFSLLLRVSLSVLPASKLVFVQYLFGLAVVEACRDLSSAKGETWGEKVRLKWPNDIYAVVGPRDEDRKKIGGILINTSIAGDKAEIVIGSGTNILNPPPITSLAQLLPDGAVVDEHLSMERALAAILSRFEPMWQEFLAKQGSFRPFTDLYLDRWLHSDQLVSLTTVTPPRKVRIVGLAEDGRLRTVAERTGWSSGDEGFIDLQPDGNSFDIMAGLIKAKS